MPVAVPDVVWHGTQDESNVLVEAIARNCTCEFGPMGTRISTCVPHRALMEDQRWLDGLLFERRTRGRWLASEFDRACSPST